MKGQDRIIATRLRGQCPGLIRFMDAPLLPWDADFVEITPTENPRRADLRFVVGVQTVSVHLDSVEALKAWADELLKAGARRVIATQGGKNGAAWIATKGGQSGAVSQ